MGKDLKGKEIGKGIRQRDSKLYEARATIDGIDIYLTNKNLAALKREFNLAIKEVKKRNIAVARKYTLNQWFEEWFNNYKTVQLKQSSHRVISSKYKHIFGDYIGDKDIKEVMNFDIQSCISIYIDTKKDAQVLRSAVSNLSECLDVAVANKLIKVNPCKAVSVPEIFRKSFIDDEQSYLTDAELKLFLDEAKKDWYYEMFYVLAYTGMRSSEICGLQWSDIDFVNDFIYVRRQLVCEYNKGKSLYFATPKTPTSIRKIPMIKDVKTILLNQKDKVKKRREYLGIRWRLQYMEDEEQYSDLVFFTTMGSPLTRAALERATTAITKRIQKKTYFKKVHPHMFRHTFTVSCFDSGIEHKAIQSVLGHSSVSFTMDVYDHISDTGINNEFKKFR